MCTAQPHRFIGLLLGCIVACSHQKNATGEAVTPAAAPPRSVLTSEEIERSHGRSIEQLLMDRFPGVQVTRTSDGGISVRIRGFTSLHGSNEPLYVIDGVPLEAVPGGALKGINPHDIESIQVLKDPSETTVYGVRGAKGVIVIRTKRR